MSNGTAVRTVMERLRRHREELGRSAVDVNDALGFGAGWVERFESGLYLPRLDIVLAMAGVLGVPVDGLFAGIAADAGAVVRSIWVEPKDASGLQLHFRYAAHDAVVSIPGARTEEYETVVDVLRDGLSRLVRESLEYDGSAIQTDSVARCFLTAAAAWPQANPSDLWWFLVYRAYMDRFNHPAVNCDLDLGQSWKRTGGWALEEVLVRHYGPFLMQHGVRLFIATREEKDTYLAQLSVEARLETDKVDVLLCGMDRGNLRCFGVVHVKASFAERRTDDVPMSQALVQAGYTSPLWTMDCKSTPSATPVNRGELGSAKPVSGPDARSAKRKDIEDDGYFSGCFSYNRNTIPTPSGQAASARIICCDFANPDDAFSAFIRARWESFRSQGT